MDNNTYKKQIDELINTARNKGLIKTYSEFCETENSKLFALQEEEVLYYTSINKKNTKKFKIGDIVFVSNYTYKNGQIGQKHIFVIIADNQAVDITYFGFLLSSQLCKSSYPYNEKLNKNSLNNLHKNSIVKCDDLVCILEADILFKIGEVDKLDLQRFVETYEKYLNEN